MPRAERLYRTEAIVLRRHDLGETDLILTMFTRDHGKIRAVAKAARKPGSKKAGHVELFTQVDLLIARGRSLDVVSQVEMVEPYAALRTDLERATYAAHFVELVDAFTEEADESRAMYVLLRDGLSWLTTSEDLERTARFFELKVLEFGGYQPQLFYCSVCRKKIQPQDQFYSVAHGGVMCPTCSRQHPRARPLSLRALKVLRYMQTRPYTAVDQVTISDATQVECERVLHETLIYHLERRLRSADFLDRLRRESRQAS